MMKDEAQELAEIRQILRKEDGRDLPLSNIELAQSVIEKCFMLRWKLNKTQIEVQKAKARIHELEEALRLYSKLDKTLNQEIPISPQSRTSKVLQWASKNGHAEVVKLLQETETKEESSEF